MLKYWRRRTPVDDTVQNGKTNRAASSNWAFDHNADIDAHHFFPGMLYEVGQYIVPFPCKPASVAAITANRLYCSPFLVTRAITIDRLAFEVTTGDAGNARVGIYNDDGTGYPGTLNTDVGTGDTTNVAIVAVAISGNLSLTPGLYWLAIVSDVAPTTRHAQLLFGSPMGYASDFNSNAGAVYMAHTYGALPATFTASLTTRDARTNQVVPRILSLN